VSGHVSSRPSAKRIRRLESGVQPSASTISCGRVVHVAHQVATLDYVSHGRAILGVGLGRDHHYTEFYSLIT